MQQLQEKEEELQELKLQLSEQKVEMERKLREKVGKGGAAGGDSKTGLLKRPCVCRMLCASCRLEPHSS